MRAILQWLTLAALVYAGWQVGPIYLRSRQFKERLVELTRKSLDAPDGVVIQRTLEFTSTVDLPLTAAGARVCRVQRHTYIDAAYTA